MIGTAAVPCDIYTDLSITHRKRICVISISIVRAPSTLCIWIVFLALTHKCVFSYWDLISYSTCLVWHPFGFIGKMRKGGSACIRKTCTKAYPKMQRWILISRKVFLLGSNLYLSQSWNQNASQEPIGKQTFIL